MKYVAIQVYLRESENGQTVNRNYKYSLNIFESVENEFYLFFETITLLTYNKIVTMF